jgi:starch-binding outer membrane protein, SusD/RagB family
MKNNLLTYTKVLAVALPVFIAAGCEVDPIEDPNNPGAGPISMDATLSEIQNLVDGTESGMRDDINFYFDDVGVIGREFYRFSTSDPRFTSDLLGKASAVLDNNTFYITNPHGSRYRMIRNANILIDALTNTTATISEAQRKAGIAYAKTVQAYQYLLALNLLYDNGIRIDVKDPDNLGPYLNRQQSLDAIMNLLNEANTDLKDNPSFPFRTTLYSSIPAQFSRFNRALAARVAVYKQDWAAANTALSESFFSLTGNLRTGVYHYYSTTGGDQLNQMFFPRNSEGEARVAQPSFITDAEPNERRLIKVPKRDAVTSQDGLSSDYDFFVYQSNSDSIPIIRNEELILLYAEVKAQTGAATEAVNAINIIRQAAGLGSYGGATGRDNLITEILKQRRYSLYGEGHRWIDMRRYDLLSQLPIDRPGDDVWKQFPIPANE